jgi:metallophosphoesterase superfamily enzyme
MPSCNLATEGSDLIRDRKLSPYLQGSLDNFKVYLLSDKVYDFGKLKNLK